MREEIYIDGILIGLCKVGEGNYCVVCFFVRKCIKFYYFTFFFYVRCKIFLIIYW